MLKLSRANGQVFTKLESPCLPEEHNGKGHSSLILHAAETVQSRNGTRDRAGKRRIHCSNATIVKLRNNLHRRNAIDDFHRAPMPSLVVKLVATVKRVCRDPYRQTPGTRGAACS